MESRGHSSTAIRDSDTARVFWALLLESRGMRSCSRKCFWGARADRERRKNEPTTQRPTWLRVDGLLGEKSIPKDSEAGREMFAKQMERRRVEEAAATYEATRGSWFLGSDQIPPGTLSGSVRTSWGEDFPTKDLAAVTLAVAFNRV